MSKKDMKLKIKLPLGLKEKEQKIYMEGFESGMNAAFFCISVLTKMLLQKKKGGDKN